jgi:hypothetical protein
VARKRAAEKVLGSRMGSVAYCINRICFRRVPAKVVEMVVITTTVAVATLHPIGARPDESQEDEAMHPPVLAVQDYPTITLMAVLLEWPPLSSLVRPDTTIKSHPIVSKTKVS